ncbi:deoxyribonuclease gamma-like isoform X2 [Ambystoma mexicanum]|uniref:deoxyribonuclease gamma-like isoform X2 n=1 Tax=Ambystoma mexicanum TaxID=8296 RepID=UPI0037E93242
MRIAAFNARRFGIKKCTNEEVFKIITRIALRYDIIVILEVFDSKEKAAKLLTDKLNRDDVVQVKETYQYEDNQEGDVDAFAREPFVVRFKSKQTALKDFALIPVHTTPLDSVKEIDELYDVFLAVKEKWKMQRVMILGDFNAEGSYVSKKKMKTLRLRQDTRFHWLICDEKDTTAGKTTDYCYDRIVVHDDMLEGIVPNSATPFNFQEKYDLTDEETLAVSDHYPVEVELKPRAKK